MHHELSTSAGGHCPVRAIAGHVCQGCPVSQYDTAGEVSARRRRGLGGGPQHTGESGQALVLSPVAGVRLPDGAGQKVPWQVGQGSVQRVNVGH